MSPQQNALQTHKICVASFEHATKLKYVGTTVANHNLIHEELRAD
jgi:hypothetical protein